MLCDISGSMEPYARAYLQFLTCAAGTRAERRGIRLRHAADARHARARLAQPRAGDPARRGRGAGLVERDADRRRAEGVQRPARTPRHGPRRRDRDPVRRLGARRPDARRSRDGAAGPPRPPDRVGQSTRQRRRVLACSRAAWWPRCRTATRSSAATASRRSARSSRRSGRTAWRRARPRCPGAGPPSEEEAWASATPVAGSSVAMPSGHGPSRGNVTPGWVTDDREPRGSRSASTRAASGRPCRRTRWAGRSRAFCDLEEHNALTAHQERQQRAQASRRDDQRDEEASSDG